MKYIKNSIIVKMDIKFIQFKHPFTALVAGPSGSGKTYFVRQLLERWDVHFHGIKASKLKVSWCHGQDQYIYSHPIGKLVQENYFEGLISEEDIDNHKPHVIVIDDLMNEISGKKSVSNLFTKGSHHKNISVIFIVQNFFHKGLEMRTISLNSHYLNLMKNARDKSQISALARQLYPSNSKFFIEAYNDATKAAYGYISVDLKPDTPDKYRVRTRILTQEIKDLNIKSYLAPIIYMPKNV